MLEDTNLSMKSYNNLSPMSGLQVLQGLGFRILLIVVWGFRVPVRDYADGVNIQ